MHTSVHKHHPDLSVPPGDSPFSEATLPVAKSLSTNVVHVR